MSKSHFIDKIIIFDNVLNQFECERLIEYYNKTARDHCHLIIPWESTYTMSIDLSNTYLENKVFKILNKINNHLSVKIKVDWCNIVHWPVGSSQGNHYDIASDKTIFTSITYLNDDYEGGETYHVNDMTIIPKMGRTVCFDGNYYEHGVHEVKKCSRYTVPIWYMLPDEVN